MSIINNDLILKLEEIKNAKNSIKTAINNKEAGFIDDSLSFSSYSDKLYELPYGDVSGDQFVTRDGSIWLGSTSSGSFIVGYYKGNSIIHDGYYYLFSRMVATSLEFKEGITKIGNTINIIPSSSNSLTGPLIFPSTLTELGMNVFRNTRLTALNFKSNAVLKDNSFYQSSYLTIVNNTADYLVLGPQCLRNCGNLTTINTKLKFESNGTYCLASCSKLTKVMIHEDVIAIPSNAFYLCNALQEFWFYPEVTGVNIASSLSWSSITNKGTFKFYLKASVISHYKPLLLSAYSGLLEENILIIEE